MLIAHDASTKKILGYTLIGHINISDNVFIGAGVTVLSNVTIGKNSIIGAGSIITNDIPPNVVVAGNLAKILMSLDEYVNKRKEQFKDGMQFDYSYTIDGGITEEQKEFMKRELRKNIGSIV